MEEKDADIVKKVLAGETAEFEKLVNRYKSKVTGVVYSYLGPYDDIEGAVQEAFLRGYKQLSTLTDHRQFPHWLVRIARNLCIDQLRKRREDLQSLEQIEDKGLQVENPSLSPMREVISREEMEEFHEAFSRLDPLYRELLTLKSFCHLSYREIEDVTGLTKSKIGEVLYKARKQLKKYLEDGPPPPPTEGDL